MIGLVQSTAFAPTALEGIRVNVTLDTRGRKMETLTAMVSSIHVSHIRSYPRIVDINECNTLHLQNCQDYDNAICENTDGSFMCTCKPGYMGNGTTCSGKPYACMYMHNQVIFSLQILMSVLIFATMFMTYALILMGVLHVLVKLAIRMLMESARVRGIHTYLVILM